MSLATRLPGTPPVLRLLGDSPSRRTLGLAATLFQGLSPAAVRLCRTPETMVSYVRESLFLYRTFTGRRGLAQRNVFDVLPAQDTLSIRLGNLGPAASASDRETWLHSVPSYAADLIGLCFICQILKPSVIFEIGTLRGYTTLHLALNSPPDARVYTLDLPRGSREMPLLPVRAADLQYIESHRDTATSCFDVSEIADKITSLHHDSATFDYSPYQDSVDFFFIDGAHSYEYVRSDTEKAFYCCHPGSVVAWHDFGRVGTDGVSTWLLELSRQRPVYVVPGGSLAYTVIEQ